MQTAKQEKTKSTEFSTNSFISQVEALTKEDLKTKVIFSIDIFHENASKFTMSDLRRLQEAVFQLFNKTIQHTHHFTISMIVETAINFKKQ